MPPGPTPSTITATNGGGTTSQTIALTVNTAGTKVAVPTFTSAAAATASSGTRLSFTITTAGSPTTTTTNITRSGTLPAGISFTNKGNGQATLTGTPTAASGGTYPLTFTAKNSAGTTTQSFVLTVAAKPTITTATSAKATDGSAFNFTVKTTGAPAPTLAESGALPQGLSWADNGDGTATLAGTPGRGSGRHLQADDHRDERGRDGNPVVHAHGERRPGDHQQFVGDRHSREDVQLHVHQHRLTRCRMSPIPAR